MRELSVCESQQAALEVLKKIADICEEKGFRYYLVYGTLIGAIRHNGFIPWDDDIDIMMPRADYNAFLAYVEDNNTALKPYQVFNPDTCAEYPYMITRISDPNYKIIMENEKEYGMGAFVDIYPYDGLGNTIDEAYRIGMKGDRLSSLCYQATRLHFAKETTTSLLKLIVKFPVYLYAKVVGKNYFQKKLQGLANVRAFDDYEYVGCVVWLSGGKKDIHKKEYFEEYEMHPFDRYMFRVPKKYDELLRNGYGDYMQLPPEKERIGHHNYRIYEK